MEKYALGLVTCPQSIRYTDVGMVIAPITE